MTCATFLVFSSALSFCLSLSWQCLQLEERFGHVALSAVGSEAAVVRIVPVMALATLGLGRDVQVERAAVTRVAGHRLMRARQHKAGVSTVIKGGGLPIRRIVAAGTLRPHGSTVYVVLVVAGMAVAGGVFEAQAVVAIPARQRRVLAKQRKVRKVMAETDARRERVLVVAVFALAAELVVVWIRRVAAHAGGRNIDAGAVRMTCLTFQAHMCAQQRKSGAGGVIEHGFPALLIVTAGALITSTPFVRVILLVAGIACRTQTLHGVAVISFLIMTGSAAETGMRTFQEKAGARVIELCLRPQACRVA